MPRTSRSPVTEAEARETYRVAWMKWQRAGADEKRHLEKVMDACQRHIARSPRDPKWKEFAESLPGYLEFWEAFRQWGKAAAAKRLEDADLEETAKKAQTN
jgi:hypothetical protein